MGGVRRSRVGAGVAVLCGLLGWAPTAGAASVSATQGLLTIQAGPGERNDLVIERSGEELRVIDLRTPVLALEGCTPVPDVPSAAVCPASAVRALAVDAGDLDDRVDDRAGLAGTIGGGPGDDELLAGAAATLDGQDGDDLLRGSPQDDRLLGGPGDDELHAAAGDDTVQGGAGADGLDGGPGNDTVRYDDGLHDAGVAVTLGGGPDDGALGENDDVRGVETVIGGGGPDAVRGTDATETVVGGPGDDTVQLLRGDDTFSGGEGDDSCLLDGLDGDLCDGGPGLRDVAAYRGDLPQFLSLDGRANDGRRGASGNLLGIEELIGGEGPDVLVGGDGDDRLAGRGGDDVLRGGGGDDDLAGDRGADVVEGGPGRDRAGYATIFVAGPIRVTLDKLPNDGEAREGDRIGRDVEVVVGSATGADLLAAGVSGATLVGLDGEDRLVGGTGADVLDGGAGADRIAALDGVRDEVRCGPGLDLTIADAFDLLRDCEARGRQRPVMRVLRRSPMLLRLRCPVVYRAPVRPYARRCRGTVTVRRGSRELRRRRLDVPSGQPRMLRGPGLRRGDVVRWSLDRLRTPVVTVRVGVPQR